MSAPSCNIAYASSISYAHEDYIMPKVTLLVQQRSPLKLLQANATLVARHDGTSSVGKALCACMHAAEH